MRAKIIISKGMRFGRLTVMKRMPKIDGDKDLHIKYLCRCDCGNTIIARSNSLRKGWTTSCGCKLREYKDITGRRFERLVALEYVGKGSSNASLWRCKCDCGKESIVRESNLQSGKTKSCGCYDRDRTKDANTKHGLYGTRLYRIFKGMKYRCYNSNADEYPHYGGKGVIVCEEWRKDVSKFYEWAVLHGYRENLTIDRIDPNGNYEPSNCQWVTLEENTRNVRKENFVKIFGQDYTIRQLAQIINVSNVTLYSRLRKWGKDKFVSTVETVMITHDNSSLYVRKKYSNGQIKVKKNANIIL